MIIGTHILLYSSDADADRKFLRDVLGLKSIDVGGGWLIFAMPPAEAGVHPIEGEFTQQHAGHSLLGCVLYLMCDDLDSEMASLQGRNVDCSEVQRAEWGRATTIPLPSGGRIGLYQPAHPTAFQRQ
jgi:catechol 2,3-dioxygenase-like lactoylglutathione lyase family enzyme